VKGQPAAPKLVIESVIFVMSATVPEVLLNFVSGNAEAAEQIIEELGEMIGITIVL
jgi:hypothetical protein